MCTLTHVFSAPSAWPVFPPGRSAGGRGAPKKGSPRTRAKRDFNRFVMRERSKWERETVSNTPERGFSSSAAPGWRGSSGAADGTYAVATLLVAWAGLRSTPPRCEKGGRAWFWQNDGLDNGEDRDVVFSVTNRWVEMPCYFGVVLLFVLVA